MLVRFYTRNRRPVSNKRPIPPIPFVVCSVGDFSCLGQPCAAGQSRFQLEIRRGLLLRTSSESIAGNYEENPKLSRFWGRWLR